jgi:hypothetical protein
MRDGANEAVFIGSKALEDIELMLAGRDVR